METKSHVWNHQPDKQIHQQTWRESVAQLTPEIGKFHTICRDSILIARVICFNHESSTKNDVLPTHSRISPSSSTTTTKGTQPTNIEYIYIYITYWPTDDPGRGGSAVLCQNHCMVVGSRILESPLNMNIANHRHLLKPQITIYRCLNHSQMSGWLLFYPHYGEWGL